MFRKIICALLIGALVLTMTAPAMAATLYGVCVTPTSDGSAYLRHTAGIGKPIVGSARNGDQLVILKKGNTWHRVQVVRTGVSGWMYGAYVRFSSDVSDVNQPGKIASSAGYANFRRGPGTSSELIMRLNNGTSIQVLQKLDGWYYVYYAAGATYGYISANLVSLTGTGNSSGAAYGTARVSSSDGFANLRKGPGTNYGIVTALTNGTQVETYASSNGWTRVDVPSTNQYGYVYTKLLNTTASSQPTNTLYTTMKVDSSDGYANFRTGAGTNHSILARLYNGVQVTLLETSGSWCKVQLSDASQTGYVYTKLLDTVKPIDTMTTTGKVNMRSGPGTGYDIRTTVAKGTAVNVLSTSGNFAQVNANGRIGYISLNYLD